jgi:hypothetical protein
MATTDYAEGYAKAEEILTGGSALTVQQIGEQLDRRKPRTRWSAGYAAAHLDYLHGIALDEDSARDVVTLHVDEDGRIVTEPGTIVAMACDCHEIVRGEHAVGDSIGCDTHGQVLVTGAIPVGITV